MRFSLLHVILICCVVILSQYLVSCLILRYTSYPQIIEVPFETEEKKTSIFNADGDFIVSRDHDGRWHIREDYQIVHHNGPTLPPHLRFHWWEK
jgi:hypothetical protein